MYIKVIKCLSSAKDVFIFFLCLLASFLLARLILTPGRQLQRTLLSHGKMVVNHLNSRKDYTDVADLLFQYYILETILKRFQRSFVQRYSIIIALYSTHSLFLCFHTYVTSFTHFTLHFLRIYTARAEYFLIPDDAVDRRKLGFEFLLLNSSSRRQYNLREIALGKRPIQGILALTLIISCFHITERIQNAVRLRDC